jgi:anti-sigma factor RsiW
MKSLDARGQACTRYPELISAYLDDELSPAELPALAGHLKVCARCSREMDNLMKVKNALHQAEPFWPTFEPSERFMPDLLEALRHEPAPAVFPRRAGLMMGGSLWRYTGLAAATLTLVLLAGGVTWFQGERPSPVASGTTSSGSALLVAQNTPDDRLEDYLRDHALESSRSLLLDNEGSMELVKYDQP